VIRYALTDERTVGRIDRAILIGAAPEMPKIKERKKRKKKVIET
jgi:hypothetical protein